MQQGAHLAADGLIHLGHQLGPLWIRLGLDIRRHDIAQHGLKIIQCAGRARALARLLHGSPRFLLALVGGGEEEGRLRELASRLGLAERVRFLGWRRDLAAVYYGSDIVALTSDNEGTPVCLIEALACGRAVVATNVGGVADVLEEGRLGLLVPPRDEAALARALLTLADGSARERFGTTGSTAIGERYGVQRLVRDVERLYDELLAQRPGRRVAA